MARARRNPRGRDMLLSLAVILVPVLILTLLLTRNAEQPEVPTVDWKPVAQQAARQAPYEVVAPAELPAGWRATRVDWTQTGRSEPTGERSPRNRWRLGALTDQQVYIELNQGDDQPAELVDEVTREGSRDGTSRVDGTEWRRLVSADDRTRSLVRETAKVTTVVTGDVSYAQLETYVGLLRPVS